MMDIKRVTFIMIILLISCSIEYLDQLKYNSPR